MKTKNTIILLVMCSFFWTSCNDVLDKNNLGAVNADTVWNDEGLAESFLNNIYNSNLPGWPTTSASVTDNHEGGGTLLYGELSAGSAGGFSGDYRQIRQINILLENVGAGTIDTDAQNLMIGQALFFRASIYFDLISTFGGVPLILKVLTDDDELDIPRSKTSECFTQIMADLDQAISLLPIEYANAGSDYGRITKGAAMAFKGRLLLHYASELFDPTQGAAGRWQEAYTTNKAAITYLKANGKDLHTSFSDLWFDESGSNPEAIMVRRYTTDRGNNYNGGCRPFVVGTNGEYFNKGTVDLFNAFPMKDGKIITDATSAYTYNATTFWLNRDPRFTATFAYNGSVWALNDPAPNRTSDLEWSFQGAATEAQADSRITRSGLNCRKAVDGSIAGGSDALRSPTDWIEIRFTEVLLNLAEAANEVGNSAEAYTILTDIRNRAGIDAGGDLLYGLQAGMSKTEMRAAVLLERRIELAFEGKRAGDLKRRRLYASVMNGKIRKGYVIKKTAAFDALNPSDKVLDDRKALEAGVNSGAIDLNDPAVYTIYFTTILRSVERLGSEIADGDVVNYLDHYYFRDIPQNDLDRNPSLIQTAGWPNGSFDPLQ